jgi:hypothetical protein
VWPVVPSLTRSLIQEEAHPGAEGLAPGMPSRSWEWSGGEKATQVKDLQPSVTQAMVEPFQAMGNPGGTLGEEWLSGGLWDQGTEVPGEEVCVAWGKGEQCPAY